MVVCSLVNNKFEIGELYCMHTILTKEIRMDCKRLFFCVLLFLLVIQTAHTDVITKVFQNGKEGYNGCEDTHILVRKGITGDTADYTDWHENFSKEVQLNIAN